MGPDAVLIICPWIFTASSPFKAAFSSFPVAKKESTKTAVARANPRGKESDKAFNWEDPVLRGLPFEEPIQMTPLFLQ
jgi:hypothetical protein